MKPRAQNNARKKSLALISDNRVALWLTDPGASVRNQQALNIPFNQFPAKSHMTTDDDDDDK